MPLPGKWQKRCLLNTLCSFLGLPSQADPACFLPSVFSVEEVGPGAFVLFYPQNSWDTCKFFPNLFHHGSLSLMYMLGVGDKEGSQIYLYLYKLLSKNQTVCKSSVFHRLEFHYCDKARQNQF